MTSAELATVAFLVTAPAVMIVVHALGSRMFAHAARQKVAALSALTACPVVMLAWWRWAPGPSPLGAGALWSWAYVAVVLLAIAYSYFHLFNMSETARRIRIIREVAAAGSLSGDAIAALYASDEVVGVRIERLLRTGQAQERDGRIVGQGGPLFWAARVLFAWRRLLGFERG